MSSEPRSVGQLKALLLRRRLLLLLLIYGKGIG